MLTLILRNTHEETHQVLWKKYIASKGVCGQKKFEKYFKASAACPCQRQDTVQEVSLA